MEEIPVGQDALIVVDREQRVVSCSEEVVRILGVPDESALLGEPVTRILGETEEVLVPLRRVLDEGEVHANVYIRYVSPQGEAKTLSITFSPLRGVESGVAGAVLTVRDVDEVRRLWQELAERTREAELERNRLAGILNSITDGVFTIDGEWKITCWNRAAEEITGYTASEAIGRPCWEVLRGSACGQNCPMRRTLETGQPTLNVEVEIRGKDGRKVPISVNTALLYDEQGQTIGAVETFRDLSTLRRLSREVQERYGFGNIVGKSKVMQEVFDLIELVSETDATVLIQGESGTGKELVARAIHYHSSRKDGPFVAVNCAALTESLLESELFGHEKGAFTGAIRAKPGRFELADGGTLFLDEIGEISPAVQVKLLRFLDQRSFERVGGTKPISVDVRIIAATNKDLRQEVREGRFREDLFYRLNVVPIQLPPLRERVEDIPLLVEHFLEKLNRRLGRNVRRVSPEAMQCLMDYDWPGNVRELENALEQALVRCRGEEITPEHLPRQICKGVGPPIEAEAEDVNPFEAAERQILLAALRESGGRRVEAARRLGVSKATLWRKMKKHGLL